MPTTTQAGPGAETRLRLLKAALKAFSQRDYDAVGTREIVDSIGVNISAISYHFGGKRGLYLATAQYLAEGLQGALRPRLERVEAALPDADAGQCRRMLGELIGGYVDILLSGGLGEEVPGFVFREQIRPTEAYDVLYDKLFGPLNRILCALISRARDLPAEADETHMVAHALLGQALFFRAGRTTMLRHLGRLAYSSDDLALMKALLSGMTEAALDYGITGAES